jgi:hypothetical protein
MMKQAMDVVWPIVGLSAVALASWLLLRELKGISLADVETAISAISPPRWALAVVAAGLAYAALACYDQIGLAHLGRRLNGRFVGLVSFCAYSLAHNVGATVFSGGLARYRAYSTKGLGVAEVGALVAFCAFTFALGVTSLGGLTLLLHPDLARRYVAAPDWAGRLVGLALLGVPSLYAIGSLLRFAPLRIRSFELVYPRPSVAARQLLVAPLDLIGGAGIIYFALPGAANPGFAVVLGVYVASFVLALVSHAPGGLGVLEYSFLKGMPDAPAADVLAALLVFRLLYFILPLMFSLIAILVFERGRIGELVRGRGGG